MPLTVYLSGEIHSDWREQITAGITEKKLPVTVLKPETNHEASDNVGADILGAEEKDFWKDHKSARINSIRIRTGIGRADIVIVKFGEKHRQWNAAFDAGYAAAQGKPLIIIHPEDFNHALKEVDAAAMAVTRDESEVVQLLEYLVRN